MEAGSHSGIARLVQQSLGTSALFLSYVFVAIHIISSLLYFLFIGPTRCRRAHVVDDVPLGHLKGNKLISNVT
jgi:hypothetical protein